VRFVQCSLLVEGPQRLEDEERVSTRLSVDAFGELAVHLDIDPNTWRRWEDGEVKFGDEKVAKTMRSILARTRARLISAIVDAGTCGRLPERLTLALLAQHGVSMNPEELGGGGFTVQIVNYGELSIGEDKLAQVRSQLSLPNGGKPELNEA